MFLNRRWQKILSLTVLAVLVLQWLWMSWLRWPDPVRDFGRELYLPWQINQGRLLYKDLHHLYGPLSVYFNAFVFHCFGTFLTSLVSVNLFLIAFLSILIFSLFRFLGGFWTAFSALLVFLGVFAFGQYTDIGNYNYVCPYAHEAVHGLILSFLALWVLKQWLLRPSGYLLIILGLLWVLIFLTKFEVFLALSLALVSVFILHGLKTKDIGWSLRRLAFVLVVFVVLFFLSPGGLTEENVLEAILKRYIRIILNPAHEGYYGNLSGFDTPGANMGRMLESALGYLLAGMGLFVVSRRISAIKEKSRRYIIVAATSAGLIASGFFLGSQELWLFFRALPLVLIGMMFFILRALFQRPLGQREVVRILVLFSITVFSFCLLFKIILNVHVYHYGFILAMPGALLLAAVFFYYLPLMGRGKWFRPSVFRVLVLATLIAIVIGHLKWADYYYHRKDHLLGHGKDAMLVWNPHVFATPSLMGYAIEWIEKYSKPTDKIVVMPEGAMINFLSRRVNPMEEIEFMPNILEPEVIKSLQKQNPDYIVLVYRDMSEYGAAFFGKDYGLKVKQWVRNNYNVIFYMQAPTETGLEFVTIYTHEKVPVSGARESEVILH